MGSQVTLNFSMVNKQLFDRRHRPVICHRHREQWKGAMIKNIYKQVNSIAMFDYQRVVFTQECQRNFTVTAPNADMYAKYTIIYTYTYTPNCNGVDKARLD